MLPPRWLPMTKDSLVLSLLYFRRITLLTFTNSTCSCVARHDRDSKRHKSPIINPYTMHRLLYGCCMVSSKFVSDACLYSSFVVRNRSIHVAADIPHNRSAKVGGLDMKEALDLESETMIQVSSPTEAKTQNPHLPIQFLPFASYIFGFGGQTKNCSIF